MVFVDNLIFDVIDFVVNVEGNETGIHDKMLNDGSSSDSFLVKNRTKQGCVMALILFDIFYFYFEEVCLRQL